MIHGLTDARKVIDKGHQGETFVESAGSQPRIYKSASGTGRTLLSLSSAELTSHFLQQGKPRRDAKYLN